jgi:signal transduction histidine kinase/DNA-binding response OmpR family regulator
VFDSGVAVGTLTIARSARPVVVRAATVGVISLLLGLIAFSLLRWLPKRALRNALDDATAAKEKVFDMTRQRDRAASAADMRSSFLSTMSHEIRTPLNAISGMLSLLQLTQQTARQQEYTAKAAAAAQSLLGLINDILDFSKIDAGKLELDLQPFRPALLMQHLNMILSANLGTKPIQLRFDIDPDLPNTLRGDSLRLEQVLINLGGNAIKFTQQGEVVICVGLQQRTAEAATLEFSVQDTGIGIAPQHQQSIFDGFSQAEKSTTRRFGGTGLGLSISKRLVTLMGGDIQVKSQLGVGSRFAFRLTFPTAADIEADIETVDETAAVFSLATQAATDAAIKTPLRRERRQQLIGMRILVVEDNPINQQVARELLRAQGAIVSIAANGRLGVDAVAATTPPFDAVLMDIQMPVLDGYGATRCIREELALPHLPIVAVTANAMASDREACLKAGMNEHIGKPFDIAKLAALLLRLTGYQAPALDRPSDTMGTASASTGQTERFTVAGLELNAALSRMSGMRSLYVQSAQDFANALPSGMQELREVLLAADHGSLLLRLHTLKGNAATLGISDLAHQAAEAEAVCKSTRAVGHCAAALDSLEQLLPSVLLRLEQAAALLRDPEPAASAPGVAPVAPMAQVLEALHSLAPLLASSNMDALQLFESVQPLLAGHPSEFVGELESAMRDLNFAQAHASCVALMARWQPAGLQPT